MLTSTLSSLRCPRGCAKGLKLRAVRSIELAHCEEVISGSLVCEACRSEYPILGGVAVLVCEVGDYLINHIKGIAQEIPEAEYPKAFRVEMMRARRELAELSAHEPIEDDLESQRVTALYVITQYLSAGQMEKLAMSAEMRELVARYWEQGPFFKLREGIGRRFAVPAEKEGFSLLELGCGVGGLLPALASLRAGKGEGATAGTSMLAAYLGVDSSFAGIALARRLALGLDHLVEHRTGHSKGKSAKVLIPEDLLFGPLSRDLTRELKGTRAAAGSRSAALTADFVVGDAIQHPAREGSWDACAALNLIDMLDRPELLPEAQRKLVRPGGWAIQSSPYIWQPRAARSLAKRYPRCRDSAQVVSQLYEERGFSVERDGPPGERDNVPWLFFKNSRQIEFYSVDLIFAQSILRRARA